MPKLKHFFFCFRRHISRKRKDGTQNKGNYLQIMTCKGLLARIYKHSTVKRKPNFKKEAKHLNRYFSTEDIQMAKKQMKRCSTSLVTWLGKHTSKPQQDTTSTPPECLPPERQIISVGEDVEKLEPSRTAGGHVKWCSHFGK